MIRSFGPQQSTVRILSFSPDGRTLATAHWRDRSVSKAPDAANVILWETATGQERCRLNTTGPLVTCVTFSPDGSLIATAANHYRQTRPDERICLWDAAMGQEVGRLVGHRGTVAALAFSPDGKVLASGSYDETILFWDPWSMIARPKPATDKLAVDRLNNLWSDLKHDDAARAYQAIHILSTHPAESVPFLRKSLFPGPAPDPLVVARLIADLDNEEFAVREKASTELARLGLPAGSALQRALEGKPSAESRRRLKELVRRLEEQMSGLEKARLIRTVEALERIATPDARKLLRNLQAGGAWSAAEDAKLALERLAKRPPS
jgi:dipeptidyl aminopeptidase/acylaminoacyl peptidase